MSILDDAIREHLALKRAHGADEAELKRLEDEAFGPPQRPDEVDPFAEAPTEFLSAPEEVLAEEGEAGGRRVPNIADLQEAPPAAEPEPEAAGPEPAAEQTFPEPPPADAPQPPSEPVAEGGPNTEERHAISEQPTQFFDVQAEMGSDEPEASAPEAPAQEPAAAEAAAPEAEQPEQPAASEPTPPEAQQPAAPPAEPAPSQPAFDDEEDEDDFWSEQRLSEELDQALEAPVTDEELLPGAVAPPPPAPPAPITEDHELEQDEQLEVGEEENAEPGESTAEQTAVHPLRPQPEDAGDAHPEHDADEHDDEQPQASYEPDTGHEDVLEDTPEFLEDAPEDDELWFEQRPPKDFDFDD